MIQNRAYNRAGLPIIQPDRKQTPFSAKIAKLRGAVQNFHSSATFANSSASLGPVSKPHPFRIVFATVKTQQADVPDPANRNRDTVHAEQMPEATAITAVNHGQKRTTARHSEQAIIRHIILNQSHAITILSVIINAGPL